MNHHVGVFAESFIGGAFDWLRSGIELTATFVRDWIVASSNVQIFGIITAAVVALAVLMRITSSRRL